MSSHLIWLGFLLQETSLFTFQGVVNQLATVGRECPRFVTVIWWAYSILINCAKEKKEGREEETDSLDIRCLGDAASKSLPKVSTKHLSIVFGTDLMPCVSLFPTMYIYIKCSCAHVHIL